MEQPADMTLESQPLPRCESICKLLSWSRECSARALACMHINATWTAGRAHTWEAFSRRIPWAEILFHYFAPAAAAAVAAAARDSAYAVNSCKSKMKHCFLKFDERQRWPLFLLIHWNGWFSFLKLEYGIVKLTGGLVLSRERGWLEVWRWE